MSQPSELVFGPAWRFTGAQNRIHQRQGEKRLTQISEIFEPYQLLPPQLPFSCPSQPMHSSAAWTYCEMWVIGVSSVSPSRSSSSAKLLVLMKGPVFTSRNAGLFFTVEKTCRQQFKQELLTAAHLDPWNTVHFKRISKTKVATKIVCTAEFTKNKTLTLSLPKTFEFLVKIKTSILFPPLFFFLFILLIH